MTPPRARMSARQRRILAYVRENPGCTKRAAIVAATEYDATRADAAIQPFYATIAHLQRRGLIVDRRKDGARDAALYVPEGGTTR